jgi:hypothetical protein
VNHNSWLAATAGVWLGGALVFGVVACADETPPSRQDLPESNVLQEKGQRLVYISPDLYPNVLAFCDGPVRIYLTTRESIEPVVVMDHPECEG